MSIKFPKWAICAINSQMANFFWNDQEDRHNYHLANMQLIAQKKEFGGLGIPDHRNLNLCLLGAWVSRYLLNENTLWRNIIDFKCETDKPNIFCCLEVGVSPFWKVLTKSTHWNLKALFAKLQNADQVCQSIWPVNWQRKNKPSNSRVYRLDFQTTLTRGISKALPIQKMTKDRERWACNKRDLLRIGNELLMPMSN